METTAITQMAMSGIFSNTGSIFDKVITLVGDVASTIVSTPIILVFMLLPIVGLGIGVFHRLLGR